MFFSNWCFLLRSVTDVHSKPTNPDTPPKTIPPPSESSPRDIPDDYYERKFGILLLRKGHKEFYVVTDKEVFEAWLSTQENIPKTRPNLRLGESGRIVRYREDYPGLVLGDITPESIGIKLLDDGVGTDYRVCKFPGHFIVLSASFARLGTFFDCSGTPETI